MVLLIGEVEDTCQSSRTMALKLSHALERPGSLVKTQIAREFLIQEVCSGVQKCACLTSDQLVLMLRVPGPHFEKHGSRKHI